MSEQVIQCAWCDKAHPATERLCPVTGLTIRAVSLADDAAMEFIGKRIDGRYLVRSVLGEGGMGLVFEAEHLKIGRPVAVKVLHARQVRNKSSMRRFYREAKAAAAIGHPNICEVYDFGTLVDGRPYLVMERLTGETLAERIAKDAVLEFDDAVDILTQVLSGLAAAHEKGIVHRDIKPENVFLAQGGGSSPATTRPTGSRPPPDGSRTTVKLLDFGISKVVAPHRKGEELDLTRPGMVMGTPHYMSPEQARGERDLDPRVDVYACGVILYEALTGCRPFTAPNYDTLLLQILSSKPRPARELRPALPPGFDAVLETAMAPAREQRYSTADDFARDLYALRGERPSQTALGDPDAERTLADVTDCPPSSVEIPVTFATDTPSTGHRLTLKDAPPAREPVDDAPTMEQTSPFILPGSSGAYAAVDSDDEFEEPGRIDPPARPCEGGPPIERPAPRSPAPPARSARRDES
jgi:serine/threonine protein kinase